MPMDSRLPGVVNSYHLINQHRKKNIAGLIKGFDAKDLKSYSSIISKYQPKSNASVTQPISLITPSIWTKNLQPPKSVPAVNTKTELLTPGSFYNELQNTEIIHGKDENSVNFSTIKKTLPDGTITENTEYADGKKSFTIRRHNGDGSYVDIVNYSNGESRVNTYDAKKQLVEQKGQSFNGHIYTLKRTYNKDGSYIDDILYSNGMSEEKTYNSKKELHKDVFTNFDGTSFEIPLAIKSKN